MDVSVVIPTFNRRHLLERSVDKYVEQRAGRYLYEVIFVINGSTDGSEAFLQEASLKYPDKVRYFYIQGTGGRRVPVILESEPPTGTS